MTNRVKESRWYPLLKRHPFEHIVVSRGALIAWKQWVAKYAPDKQVIHRVQTNGEIWAWIRKRVWFK